jgi:GTP pyrophosphokinase
VPAGDVVRAAYPGIKLRDRASKIVSLAGARRRRQGSGEGIPIRGLIPGMALHYAGCCHPLPGDRIVGIVTTGKGVTIHTIDCETLENYAEEPQRWLDVAWERQTADPAMFTGRIDVTIANEPGSLSSLSTIIAQNFGNITNLKITNRSQDFFDMRVDIEVQDAKHLTNIIAALRAAPVVNSVDRARG